MTQGRATHRAQFISNMMGVLNDPPTYRKRIARTHVQKAWIRPLPAIHTPSPPCSCLLPPPHTAASWDNILLPTCSCLPSHPPTVAPYDNIVLPPCSCLPSPTHSSLLGQLPTCRPQPGAPKAWRGLASHTAFPLHTWEVSPSLKWVLCPPAVHDQRCEVMDLVTHCAERREVMDLVTRCARSEVCKVPDLVTHYAQSEV